MWRLRRFVLSTRQKMARRPGKSNVIWMSAPAVAISEIRKVQKKWPQRLGIMTARATDYSPGALCRTTYTWFYSRAYLSTLRGLCTLGSHTLLILPSKSLIVMGDFGNASTTII